MTNGMIHEELYDALAAEAVDALDGEEREHLLAHLAGCEACSAELRQLRESAALLAFAAPVRAMEPARSARLRERLLARVSADGASKTPIAPAGPVAAGDTDSTLVAPAPPAAPREADTTLVAPAPPPVAPVRPAEPARPDVIPITSARRRATLLPWLAAAASLVLLLGVGAWALSLRGRLESMGERVAALESRSLNLQRAVEERDATLNAISGPASRVIELAAATPEAPSGRMFWDVSTNRWTFFAHHLPPTRPGREYQLWLITPEQHKIPSVTFRPDPTGHAVVQVMHPLHADSLAAVAVTEEPTGGLPAPSGPVVIVGAAATE